MNYQDYRWKDGIPYGISLPEKGTIFTYRLFQDPYRKRFSVEEYEKGAFKRVVYDSGSFDFRVLFKEEDAAWQREILEEDPTVMRSIIRNMEERIILIEEHLYKDGICLGCKLYSPQGVFVGTQTVLDKERGDEFDGVKLEDATGRKVLQKKYAKDPVTGDFGALLESITSF